MVKANDIEGWLTEPLFKSNEPRGVLVKEFLLRFKKVDINIHIHDTTGYISVKDIFDEIWRLGQFGKTSGRARSAYYDRFKKFIKEVFPSNYYEKLNYQVGLLKPGIKERKAVCIILAQVQVRSNKKGRFMRCHQELSFKSKLDDDLLRENSESKVRALSDIEIVKLTKKYRLTTTSKTPLEVVEDLLRSRLVEYYIRY